MRELSLHILDIAQNSIAAGAKHIQIVVNENENGFFVFKNSLFSKNYYLFLSKLHNYLYIVKIIKN